MAGLRITIVIISFYFLGRSKRVAGVGESVVREMVEARCQTLELKLIVMSKENASGKL